MTIAIIDYEGGNLASVNAALTHLGYAGEITQSPQVIAAADRVIFPGVGYAETCMRNLRERGLDVALRDFYQSGKPLLAICVGLQLLFANSAESENPRGVECLNLLAGQVKKFAFPPARKVKIPHMGWNEILPRRPHPVLADFIPQTEMYFVHSYFVSPENPDDTLAETEYGGEKFVCMAAKNNLVATQFHPEKSGERGLRMLKNFCEWNGKV